MRKNLNSARFTFAMLTLVRFLIGQRSTTGLSAETIFSNQKLLETPYRRPVFAVLYADGAPDRFRTPLRAGLFTSIFGQSADSIAIDPSATYEQRRAAAKALISASSLQELIRIALYGGDAHQTNAVPDVTLMIDGRSAFWSW
jgi:hypothetical protein